MVLFRGRYSVRNEDVIPDISAPRLLRMTAIRNSMRAEQQFIGDKRGGVCGVEEGKTILIPTVLAGSEFRGKRRLTLGVPTLSMPKARAQSGTIRKRVRFAENGCRNVLLSLSNRCWRTNNIQCFRLAVSSAGTLKERNVKTPPRRRLNRVSKLS